MADVVAVATVDQLAPGHGMTVTVRGVPVALFNVKGTVYAIDDLCRHEGVSLGSGELRGHIVRCRAHGWRYDVTTAFLEKRRILGGSTFSASSQDGSLSSGFAHNVLMR